MRNKPNDIKYLNCDPEKIRTAKPVFDEEKRALLLHFIRERYMVYKRRSQGQERPWTDDPILHNYRFTNIRREHDKTTKWYIDHIANNPNLGLEDKMYRAVLFRLYNTIKTAEIIRLDDVNFWNNVVIGDKSCYFYNPLVTETRDIFTRAFRTVGSRKGMKPFFPQYNYKLFPIYLMKIFGDKNGFRVPELAFKDVNFFIKWLKLIPGIADFMAYQVFVDCTYIKEFPISENEFVIAGPGTRNGIDMTFTSMGGLTYEELIFWLRDNQSTIFSDLDPDFSFRELFDNLDEDSREWNVMSIENTFCEFQKYNYYLRGTYRIHRKY